MAKGKTMVRCNGVEAKAIREAKYRSPNLFGETKSAPDPKTVRLIEAGELVSLTKVQEYAHALNIETKDILDPEFHSAIEGDTTEIDRSDVYLFPEDPKDKETGQITINESKAFPCGITKITELLQQQGVSPPIPRIRAKPAWELEVSVRGAEGLSSLMKELDKAMEAFVPSSHPTTLTEIADILALREKAEPLMEQLESDFGLHILGSIIGSSVYFNRPGESGFATIKIPWLLICPLCIKEARIKYQSRSPKFALVLDFLNVRYERHF